MTTSTHWGDGDRRILDAWITHGVPDSIGRDDMLDMLVRLHNRHRALSASVSELVALLGDEPAVTEAQEVLW